VGKIWGLNRYNEGDWIGLYHKVTQTLDTSDETTGMAGINEYGYVVREMYETL